MRPLGTRLVVTGPEVPWSPGVTPSCHDNRFASMGPTIASQTMAQHRNNTPKAIWRPSIPAQFKLPSPPRITPHCNSPQFQPSSYSIDLPPYSPLPTNNQTNSRGVKPPVATVPETEMVAQYTPTPKSSGPRCTWKPAMGAANNAYIPRVADQPPPTGLSKFDKYEEQCGLRTPDRSQSVMARRPTGWTTMGYNAGINLINSDTYGRPHTQQEMDQKERASARPCMPRNVCDSDGGMWIRSKNFTQQAPIAARKHWPGPLPYAPHMVPSSQCREHMMRGTIIPVKETRGELQRSPSLSAFVGLDHEKNRNLFRMTQGFGPI